MSALFSSFLQRISDTPLWQYFRLGLDELLHYATSRGWLHGQHVLLHQCATPASANVYRLPGFDQLPGLRHAQLHALQLSAGTFLERPLSVPSRLMSKVEDVIRLEVETVSPFGAEDTVWGWRLLNREAQQLQLGIAIASRTAINQQLAKLRPELAHNVEIWAPSANSFIVIKGFAEEKRKKQQQRTLRTTLTLTAIAAIATILVTLTPAWMARQQLKERYRLFANTSQQAQPILDMRTELSALENLQETLVPHLSTQKDALTILEQVSTILPDSVWLSSFILQDNTLRLNGYAKDGGSVLRLLQEQSGFNNVRSVSPLMLDRRWQKERFSIELDLAS